MPEEKETILKVGETLNRRYKIEKYLGGGAFGEVYRVYNNYLKQRRAIKVFKVSLDLKGNDSTLEEFLEEAVILTKFDHRNIVKVHDADTFIAKDGQEYVFFVMDFVSGGDLSDHWKSYGAKFIPIDEVIDIIKQICEGLNILHSENPPMIHRDIKPQNIMIGYEKKKIVAKLTDFGLVKAVNPSTLYASAKGTLAFKAPEFLDGKDDTSTDMFAVGVTFYMLLTDHLPYPIDNELELLTGSNFKKIPKPIDYYNPLAYDKRLNEIVFKAISTEPKERYQNAKELLDALEEWEENKSKETVEKVERVKAIVPGITDDEDEDDDVLIDPVQTKPEEIKTKPEPKPEEIKTKPEPKPEEIKTKPEPKTTKELPNDGNKFIYASDALAQLRTSTKKMVLDDSSDYLGVLNSTDPPEKLVSEALKIVSKKLDYNKGVQYLEQAFSQNESLKGENEHKLELWKAFLMIQNPSTIDEGIDRLKELIDKYPSIKSEYGFAYRTLSSKDINKMETKALNYIKRNYPQKASAVMELAMLVDDGLKKKYRFKIRNWKKGILN